MKRSRHSKYDKKRTRSKKDSKRNSTSTNKALAKPKSSIDRLQDFEITENQEKKYRHRQVRPKKTTFFSKAKWPIIIVVIFIVVKLLLNVNSCE